MLAVREAPEQPFSGQTSSICYVSAHTLTTGVTVRCAPDVRVEETKAQVIPAPKPDAVTSFDLRVSAWQFPGLWLIV